MKYLIRDNGEIDIKGKEIELKGAYPFVNKREIHPKRIELHRNGIRYEIDGGVINIVLCEYDHGIEIHSSFAGEKIMFDFSPLGLAQVSGVNRCFIQGQGMEGPSGFFDVDEESRFSYGLIGLSGKNSSMVCFARDHKNYNNKYRIGKSNQAVFGSFTGFGAGFQVEGVKRKQITFPTIYIAECDEIQTGLKKAAIEIAEFMGARKQIEPEYHWCSWYYLYHNLTQELLETYLEGMKEESFKYIQIDAGYTPHMGDWLLPNHRFKEGLKKAAETIIKAGFLPGIWVGVFIVGDQSELFKNHPDWIIRNKDNSPYIRFKSYNEPKIWGDEDTNYFVLDASNPEVLEYIREVFTTLYRWGFRMYKTDFMFWGMADSSVVQRYDNSKTSVELMREVLSVIRESIGESYFLGCIAPFMPFIGYVDGMRIAGDVGASWKGTYGPLNLIREMAADNYFNHIYWQNDPDSLILRDFDIHLRPEEIRSLVFMQALSGGVVTTSDPIHKLSKSSRILLDMVKPKMPAYARFPYLNEQRDDLVITHVLPKGKLLFVLNTSDCRRTFAYDLKQLFDINKACVYEWREENHPQHASEEDLQRIVFRLDAHDSKLYFITDTRLNVKPMNLWEWQ